jgi:hypothetical protein
VSIIYDALQKTQQKREYVKLQSNYTQPKAQNRWVKPIGYALVLLLLSASTGALVAMYWPSANKKELAESSAAEIAGRIRAPRPEGEHLWVSNAINTNASNAVSAHPTGIEPVSNTIVADVSKSQQPDSLPFDTKLILNGVLISGIEKIALINSQPFHLGDLVQGMKIVAIEPDSVKLQEGQNVFEIKVSA